jgi:hypothetical protein
MEQILNITGRGLRGSRFAIVSPMSRSRFSQFFPVGQRHQLVENFLQPLKPTFVIPRFARYLLFAAMGVQTVRFTDLRYFFSQFHDAVFNGILHDDRLAERKAPESIQFGANAVCGRNGRLHEIVCANEPKNHPHKKWKSLPGGIMYDGWCGKLIHLAVGLTLASRAASTFLPIRFPAHR